MGVFDFAPGVSRTAEAGLRSLSSRLPTNLVQAKRLALRSSSALVEKLSLLSWALQPVDEDPVFVL